MHSGSALWSGWGMKVRANEERHESVTDGSQCPSKLRAVLVVASEARDRSGLVWTGLAALAVRAARWNESLLQRREAAPVERLLLRCLLSTLAFCRLVC